MSRYKVIFRSDSKATMNAFLSLLVDAGDVFSVERLEGVENDADALPMPANHTTPRYSTPRYPGTRSMKPGLTRAPHKRVTGRVNRLPATSAAGEFLAMAQANPSGKVSIEAYYTRLVKLGYAATTAKVMVNKLHRAGYARIEGGHAILTKTFKPYGLDSRLRKEITGEISIPEKKLA